MSTAPNHFNLQTNLAQLPFSIHYQLANSLNTSQLWHKLVAINSNNDSNDESSSRLSIIYRLSANELELYSRDRNPGSALLRLWGNRGQTVKDFLTHLHNLAKIHGHCMDIPQLILRRKFVPLIWSRAQQIIVTPFGQKSDLLKLVCHAKSFPHPHFQWLDDGREIDNETTDTLIIPRCVCSAKNVYSCRVWSEVENRSELSMFYRAPGKQFRSELVSDLVDLSAFVSVDDEVCDRCKQEQLARLQRIMDDQDGDKTQPNMEAHIDSYNNQQLFASDKVALIISNCNYEYLPDLITPHCDAETLAQALQDMNYKTVTLGNLNLAEMQFIIREYKKLLGNGVYAIFYFVGHGFEANGQCYLLGVDAPADDYQPEQCVSIDWVMSVWHEHTPALNLILLDICRKSIPCDMTAFVRYAEQFRLNARINRNTVYGYATSGGVNAYEVRGESNGVFMKYLRNHLDSPVSVIEMLNRVFWDIESDQRVCDVQVPELRSNLAHARSLLDPLVYDGHTHSFEYHTIQWRYMHELPSPVHVDFEDKSLRVTVWCDFVGHFTNKVYVFSSVGDLGKDDDSDMYRYPSGWAHRHFAYLRFQQNLEVSHEKVLSDNDEGVSLCLMLSDLQRAKGEIRCSVELADRDNDMQIVASSDAVLGHLLINKLFAQ